MNPIVSNPVSPPTVTAATVVSVPTLAKVPPPRPVSSGRLVVSPLPDGNFWQVEKNLVVEFYGLRLAVRRGEITDFASVPRIIAWLFPKRAIFSVASIFHDHLYRTGETSKWMADALFFSLLRYEPDPVGWCCRSLMWVGVWAFGWFAWWKHRRNEA